MTDLILIITASRRRDGAVARSQRGSLYDGAVDGQLVVERSAQPLLDTCRASSPKASRPGSGLHASCRLGDRRPHLTLSALPRS